MIVVLPVCHKDHKAALRNLAWIRSMESSLPHSCLVAHEVGFPVGTVLSAASDCFASVSEFAYPALTKRSLPWPAFQNWAWRKSAIHVRRLPSAHWLWWEQDAVPLRKGWLNALDEAYRSNGKPFMGAYGARPTEKHPLHLNGVAIYPHDMTSIAPSSMFYGAEPFDVAGGWRVLGQAAISPLFQHVWSWDGSGGSAPIFMGEDDLDEISKEAVIFHRCKDASLISQLKERPMTAKPKRKPWVLKRRMKARGAPKTPPPCMIMLSGVGDILIVLCIARHYANLFGAPVPFITSAKYRTILEGASYVIPAGMEGSDWHSYHEAIAWAKERFGTVLPLHMGEPEILRNQKTDRFCHEQYLYAGVPKRYGDLPLVFDQRNLVREADLVKRIDDGRPIFLYNFIGRTSPLKSGPAIEAQLVKEWGSRLNLVNTSALNLSHYFDLLGLLEKSIGMISIDTSNIHLMAASQTPYIALLNDLRTPWWSSVPRGNCVLQIGYSAAANSIGRISKAIQTMLGAVEIKRPQPVLVTMAINGMEKVWELARKTWEPYCLKHGYSLHVVNEQAFPLLPPSWSKLRHVAALLDKHEEVWWIDADLTVARLDAPPLPQSDKALAFASDWNGLCAAMFRATNANWVKQILTALPILGDVRDDDLFGKGLGPKWEQNAIKILMRDFPDFEKLVGFLPNGLINDHPEQDRGEAFCHFGAMTNEQRIAAMKKRHCL